jgi:hypothetical protein
VRFRAVDKDSGVSVEGVTAGISSGNIGFSLQSDDGAFAVEDVQPGRFQVSLSAKGYAAAIFERELEPGADTDLGDLAIGQLQRLRVLVRRPPGTTGVLVQCEPEELVRLPGGPDGLGVWKKDVKDDHDAVVMRLTAERWCVWAEGNGPDGPLRSAQQLATVEEGENQVTVELVPPVQVTLRAGADARTVLVRDEHGLWVGDPLRVAAEGESAIALVPGSYELVVRGTASDERVLPLQVGAQETVVDLR